MTLGRGAGSKSSSIQEIKLDGNAASVHYDSSVLWGTGDQYAVSHFSVAGPISPGPGLGVPDGGTTAAMLECAPTDFSTWRKFPENAGLLLE